jgi:SAM-dependent methyltransferase
MAQPRLYGDLAWVWPFVSPPEEYDEEAAELRATFARHGVGDGARVLHLGCGGGSIDWHLKQHYRVTGVDLSAGMLAHARRVNPEVEYQQGDMRDVRLGRTFDAVLVHDAIAYMLTGADLRAAYRTAAAHLAPGGVLLATPEQVQERFQQHRTEAYTRSDGARTVTVTIVDSDPDPTDNTCKETFCFLIREGDRLTVEVDEHDAGIYPLAEFAAAIEEAGFAVHAYPVGLPILSEGEAYPLIVGVRGER